MATYVAADGWGWSLNPMQVAPVAVAVFLYARRVHLLSSRGRPVRLRTQAFFYTGIAVVLLALVSPVDTVGEERLFYVHMIQHLMLGDIAPLLVVLGLSGALLRPVLALPGLAPLRALAHPLVALPLWAFNFYLWHLPALYQAALRHDALHALEHVLFFTTGALMWAAVVEPLPGPAWFGTGPKAVYTLVVRAAGGVLAMAFIWSGQAFYPYYAAGERVSGISPLSDQQIGGLIMFIEGGIVTLLVFGVLFLRWVREAELRQTLLEEGHDPSVAARAARYGRRSPPAQTPAARRAARPAP